ncbi:MAG: nitroreductase [Acholeplasmataceae bacterium]|jgi:nitroreductase|nr:nitroreductase [Acholeplasmataceae bacterium]
MSIEHIIKNRVSTSKFTPERVNPELLIDLLDVAVYAPNHKLRQPWRFIILEGQGKETFVKKYLQTMKETEQAEVSPKLQKVMDAPAVVVFIMKKNPIFQDDLEDLQACAALMQNFLLLLVDHNMAGFWKTPNYIQSDKFKDTLNLATDEIVVGMIMVGYPEAMMIAKPRKSAKELTTIY